jgi:signal peptidase I
MEPTLIVGDYFITDYRYYKTNPVKPNEVIVLRFPKDPKRKYIERCIAIGGQVVEIKDKRVFVYGKIFSDSLKIQFIDTKIISKEIIDPEIYPENIGNRDNYGPITVPRDHCFVLGDNRGKSYDSRYWGFVSMKDVIAKPLYIYWAKDKTRIGRHID